MAKKSISPALRTNRVKAGDYILTQRGNFIYLCHRTGEGMEVREEKLEKLLDEFYRKEF